MASDDLVVIAWVGANYGIDAVAFAAQVAFLVFVAATVRIAWGGAPVWFGPSEWRHDDLGISTKDRSSIGRGGCVGAMTC